MPTIYAEIQAERSRQDAQWGGPDHDDDHCDADWQSYRQRFERRVLDCDENDLWCQRANVLKIAALAVAQLESIDRQLENTGEPPPTVDRARWDAARSSGPLPAPCTRPTPRTTED